MQYSKQIVEMLDWIELKINVLQIHVDFIPWESWEWIVRDSYLSTGKYFSRLHPNSHGKHDIIVRNKHNDIEQQLSCKRYTFRNVVDRDFLKIRGCRLRKDYKEAQESGENPTPIIYISNDILHNHMTWCLITTIIDSIVSYDIYVLNNDKLSYMVKNKHPDIKYYVNGESCNNQYDLMIKINNDDLIIGHKQIDVKQKKYPKPFRWFGEYVYCLEKIWTTL